MIGFSSRWKGGELFTRPFRESADEITADYMKWRAKSYFGILKLLSQYGPSLNEAAMKISLSDINFWLVAIEGVQKPVNDPPYRINLNLNDGTFFAVNIEDSDCPEISFEEKADLADPYSRPLITFLENRESKLQIRLTPTLFLEIPILERQVWEQWHRQFLKQREQELIDKPRVNDPANNFNIVDWEHFRIAKACEHLATELDKIGLTLVLKP
jgi:hypothetical protein